MSCSFWRIGSGTGNRRTAVSTLPIAPGGKNFVDHIGCILYCWVRIYCRAWLRTNRSGFSAHLTVLNLPMEADGAIPCEHMPHPYNPICTVRAEASSFRRWQVGPRECDWERQGLIICIHLTVPNPPGRHGIFRRAWVRTNRSGFSAHLTVLNPPSRTSSSLFRQIDDSIAAGWKR